MGGGCDGSGGEGGGGNGGGGVGGGGLGGGGRSGGGGDGGGNGDGGGGCNAFQSAIVSAWMTMVSSGTPAACAMECASWCSTDASIKESTSPEVASLRRDVGNNASRPMPISTLKAP